MSRRGYCRRTGRYVAGKPRALSEHDVRLVRALRKGPVPMSYSKIAEKMECGRETARRAAIYKTYQEVA